jgi:multicomponent Na+:H+ antiporter subunit E
MTTRVLGPLLLLGLWMALWGRPSWATFLGGLLVVGLVAAWLWPQRRPGSGYRVHPVALARLVVVFGVQLVRGSLAMAAAVFAPTPTRLATHVVRCRLTVDRPLVTTLVADLVSLVPGSVTIGTLAGPARLEVHVMGTGTPAEARAEVARLEARVLAAFEPLGSPADDGPGGDDTDQGGRP